MGPSGFGIILGERGGEKGRYDAAALPASVRERVAHEMDTAAPSCGMQKYSDGSFDAFMHVGDHHAARPAPHQG